MSVSSERFSLKSFQPLVTINVPEKECLVEDESTETVENTETAETNETVLNEHFNLCKFHKQTRYLLFSAHQLLKIFQQL